MHTGAQNCAPKYLGQEQHRDSLWHCCLIPNAERPVVVSVYPKFDHLKYSSSPSTSCMAPPLAEMSKAPEKSGKELFLIFSHQGFWRRFSLVIIWRAVGVVQVTTSVVELRQWFSSLFVLCSVSVLVTGIYYLPCALFVTSMSTTKLALAANPAMPTSLAETSGGEKRWNALWELSNFSRRTAASCRWAYPDAARCIDRLSRDGN